MEDTSKCGGSKAEQNEVLQHASERPHPWIGNKIGYDRFGADTIRRNFECELLGRKNILGAFHVVGGYRVSHYASY